MFPRKPTLGGLEITHLAYSPPSTRPLLPSPPFLSFPPFSLSPPSTHLISTPSSLPLPSPFFSLCLSFRPSYAALNRTGALAGLFDSSSGPAEVLHDVHVARQPGDGNCLFHSLSYGLRDGSTAAELRKQIVAFIEANPDLEIQGSPIKDWVQWETTLSVGDYCTKMRGTGEWGGAIEMAALSRLRGVHVLVYERNHDSAGARSLGASPYGGIAPGALVSPGSSSSGSSTGSVRRVHTFEPPPTGKAKVEVRVLYCGGVHYDALALGSATATSHLYDAYGTTLFAPSHYAAPSMGLASHALDGRRSSYGHDLVGITARVGGVLSRSPAGLDVLD